MKKTYNGLSNKAGIYKIVNVVNKKAYYGKCSKFSTRACQHIRALNAGKHFNKHLQGCWNKHGPESFEFIAIESIETEEDRRTAEQALIDKHHGPGCYNMQKTVVIAPSAAGYKSNRTTEQRRECMLGKNKRKHTPEQVEANRLAHIGVKQSKECCIKKGNAVRGQKNGMFGREPANKGQGAKRFQEALHTVIDLYLSITK